MIKKWSYVAAAMLTVASGVALTSCIDNDEPFGIEQIRVATASLLESKKAAVEAEAAAKSAEVEIAKIWAEVEKMKVEKDQILAEAEAKIKEAQAKAIELEAQANAAKTQAEADQLKAQADYWTAQAEYQKAVTDAYMAEKEAKLNEYIAKAEIWVKESQLEYEKTLYAFEKEKLYNADQYTSGLYQAWAIAFQAYLDQLAQVNTLTKDYYDKVKDFARAEVDLIPVVEGGKIVEGEWTSPNYDALAYMERSISYIQEKIDYANKLKGKTQEFIDQLKNVADNSTLYQLFEDYQKEAKENEAKYADVMAEFDAFNVNNKELVDTINLLQSQINKFNSNKIDIPAYTWDPKDFNEDAFKTLGITEPKEIVPERDYYTLEDFTTPVLTAASNYTTAVKNYESQINALENFLLDANDVKWTEARINEMKRQRDQQQAKFDEAKTDWENAKKAYHMGGEPVYTAIPNESQVEAAVKTYNDTKASINPLRNTYIDAFEASQNADQLVYDLTGTYPATRADNTQAANTFKTAYEKYNQDLKDNQEDYENAIKAAQAKYDNAVADALNAYQKALREETTKQNVYNEVLKANNNKLDAPDVVAAKSALDLAKADKQAKEQAYKKDVPAAALAVQQQENLDARTDLIEANNRAENTYAAAKATFESAVGSQASNELLAALKDAENKKTLLNTAKEAYNKEASAVQEKLDQLETLCNEQSVKVGGWDTHMSELQTDFSLYINTPDKDIEFPVAIAPAYYMSDAGIYVNVKDYLINMSQIAFGYLGTDYDSQTGVWDVDKAFLVDDVTVDMVNDYIKEYMEVNNLVVNELEYYSYYNQFFGLYGDLIYTKNRIQVAEVMANQDLLDSSIKPLNDGLEALKKSKEDAEDAKKVLENKKQDKKDEYDVLAEKLWYRKSQIEGWRTTYDTLLSDLTALIAELEIQDLEGYTTSDANTNNLKIDKYIKAIIEKRENDIEWYDNQIAKYEKDKARAEYQLQQYKDNEGVMNANPVQNDLDAAYRDLEAAKEKLAFLKARADELETLYKDAQARYEGATSNK